LELDGYPGLDRLDRVGDLPLAAEQRRYGSGRPDPRPKESLPRPVTDLLDPATDVPDEAEAEGAVDDLVHATTPSPRGPGLSPAGGQGDVAPPQRRAQVEVSFRSLL